MLKITQEYQNKKYIRINKTRARRLYYGGATIAFAPCKARFGAWIAPALVSLELCDDAPFCDIVARFEWFNCNYSELGEYAAFYEIEGAQNEDK